MKDAHYIQLPLFENAVEIEIAKGYTTLLSREDIDLARFRWGIHKGITGRLYIRRRRILNHKKQWQWLHRVVLERTLGRKLERDENVDHINNDPLDNRRDNLRVASRSQNLANTLRSTNRYSKLKGARYNKRYKSWSSSIQIDGKLIYLGTFSTDKEAHEAYKKAHAKRYGEFSPYFNQEET